VEQGTSLSGFLARLGGGRNGTQDSARSSTQPGTNGGAVAAGAGADQSISTKAFSRFLAALKHRDSPVLLDLGPVVGSNINYFGEKLGCKFFIEDVYANLEKYARENRTKELAEFFKSRFPQGDASFDGILCWDIFDYLDKAAAQTLAQQMTRLLKPGGALLTFFATVAMPGKEYTRYLVVDDKTFKHKTAPAARGRQQVFVNRDINIMFQGLNVSDSFLLMTRTREIVFRKPEQKTGASTGETTTALGTEGTDGTEPGSSAAEPSASTKGPETPAAPERSKSSSVSARSATTTTIMTTSTATAIAAPTTTTATPMAMSASTPNGRNS
jgi:SAM-dependent methyltransferase